MAKLKNILSQQSVKVVLVYILFSMLWIAYTDKVVEELFTDPNLITQVQTFKGWFFVLISGIVLFWVIRKSGRQVEKNRDLYKAMLDDAKVGIARMENLRIVSSNPAFRNLVGRTEKELKESTLDEYIDKYDRQNFLKIIQSLSYQEYAQQELKLILNRNDSRWVQINFSKHSGDEEEYIQVILQDINDRKTFQTYTELLLQVMLTMEPTDNFKEALNGILQNLCLELNWEYGIALIPDEGGKYKKEVSWYRLDPLLDEYDFKVDRHSFGIGEGLTGLTVKEKKSIWVEDLEQDKRFMHRDAAVEADLRSIVSIPLVVSDEVIAVLMLFSRQFFTEDKDQLKLLTAIGHDIGNKLEKRKQQDEKLELENSLNYALKSAGMATWDIELESGNVIRSQNHHELFGLEKAPDSWNVRDMLNYILEEDREKVENNLNEAVLKTKGYNEEFRIRKNGSVRWLWSRGDLQFDRYGEPERLTGVITDITKKKQFQIYTELLLEITLSIETLKEPGKAFDNILKVICNKSIWQYGEIWQYEKNTGGAVVCTNNWYREGDKEIEYFARQSMGKTFEADIGLPGIGKNSEELLWIPNIGQDERFIRKKEAEEAGLKSVVSIPVNSEGSSEATILLFTKYEISRDNDSIKFLKAIRNNIGIKLAKKRTELELDRERELLEMLYENIPVMITIYRPDFSQFRVNEEFEKVTGWTNEDLPNIDLFDEVYPDVDSQKIVKDFMNKADSGWMDIEMTIRTGEKIQSTWTNVRLSDDTQIGIGLDITERKLHEEQIHRHRDQLLEAEKVAKMGHWEMTLTDRQLESNDNRIYVSETLLDLFDIEEQDFDGTFTGFMNLIHPEDKEEVVEKLKNQISEGSVNISFRVMKPSGDIIHTHAIGEVEYNRQGEPVLLKGVNQDITDLYRIEEELIENQRRLKLATTSANVGLWEWYPKTGKTVFDEVWAKLVGYTLEELEPVSIETWNELVHPEDLIKFEEAVSTYIDGASSLYECEVRMKHKDGYWVWILDRGRAVEWDDDGEPLRMVGTHIDITERKEAEEIQKYNSLLLKNISEAVIAGDEQFRITSWNERAAELYGWTFEEIKGKTIREVIHTDYLNLSGKEVEKIFHEKGEWKGEVTQKKKDGTVIYVLSSVKAVVNDEGEVVGSLAVNRDITELKEQQKLIEEKQLQLMKAQQIARMGYWKFDLEDRSLTWSDMVYSIFAVDRDKFELTVENFISRVHPADRKKLRISDQQLHEEGMLEHVYRYIKPGGDMVYVQERGELVVTDDGTKKMLTGTVIDITDLKKIEEKLAAERQRFELAVSSVSDVVWDFNAEENKLWWNEGIETVFGFNRQKILGKSGFWEKHIHKEDRKETVKSMRKAEQSDAAEWSASYRFLDADGNVHEVEDSARIIRDDDGKLKRIIGAMVDVTELKNYQRELLEERKRFEIIAQSTNDIIYDLNLVTDDLWANEEIYTIMGFDLENLDSPMKWWEEHIHPDDRKRVVTSQDELFKSDDQKWAAEYRFEGRNGRKLHILENAFVIRDDNGRAVRMLGAMIDVTAEKETERVLRESEEQYRRLFEQNPYPMWIFNPKTFKILEVNQSTVDKYGYSKKQFESMTIHDFHTSEDKEAFNKLLSEKKNSLNHYEDVTHVTSNGKTLIVNITALDIQYKGKQQRLVVANDVTKQKKAEEKVIGSVIEGSENERRRIAKELHDGLGQHLTAASMNLDSVYEELQSLPKVKWNQYEKGLKLIRDAIVESRRISQNLLPKAIEDFGLSLAVQSLVDDFKGNNNLTISFSDNLDDVNLNETVELNIYRIIQEGINNAVRHSGCSRIDIQLILDDKQLNCTIEDNGKGYDIKADKNGGLGLKSIRNRVNAMSGEVDFSSSKRNGTLISVIVPVKIV